jgi:hypothetical protein
MKLMLIILGAAIIFVGALSVVVGKFRKPSSAANTVAINSATASPLACDMVALTPAIRKRHFEELSPQLRALRKSVRELPDGYEFEFPADANTYAMLTEWSIQERDCCPFFDIEIQLDREGGPMWLRLTGREGTKEFIQTEAAAWIKQ